MHAAGHDHELRRRTRLAQRGFHGGGLRKWHQCVRVTVDQQRGWRLRANLRDRRRRLVQGRHGRGISRRHFHVGHDKVRALWSRHVAQIRYGCAQHDGLQRGRLAIHDVEIVGKTRRRAQRGQADEITARGSTEPAEVRGVDIVVGRV